MALVVYWYDFICFGIVGIACLGALYVLWRREGAGKCSDRTVYESLLVERPDADGYVGVTPRGHVRSSQLWTSCWRGLHPAWLFGLRFASFGIMSGFLAWDIKSYNASIFLYYTEWTFALVVVYFAIGTIVSAHGCVLYYTRKLPYENGVREEFPKRDLEENISSDAVTSKVKECRGTIKLQSHYNQEAIRERAGFWGYLMQTAYQTCAGAVILTDIVFWCIIVPFLSNAHLELNMPFPWFRLAYFVLWSCCYVIFQYFCLAVVHIPCYGLYYLVVRAKNSILPRLFPRAFVREC
ncbi:hypothetical protein RJ639_033619 [Escallonia herrerae]|uniref:Uncharacterized protein n=1 Tax=Escallonia herrerae TaxID=1293975 RepID=A0AA89B972_9ASTE|nr:hypothetical protein RJ639_033619 [Escallonia herrerae]